MRNLDLEVKLSCHKLILWKLSWTGGPSIVVFAARRLLAEILFLRRQLAFYRERKSKARRPDPWTKLALVWLSGLFDWRDALEIVKPATFIRWHRAGFRLLWRWKSRRRGRPALPKDIRSLIRLMASENPSWGEERIADELSLGHAGTTSSQSSGQRPSTSPAERISCHLAPRSRRVTSPRQSV
jgi:hypothetical protein